MPPAEPLLELDPLSRLAIRHGTDKFGGHLYTPSYHRILGHLREKPIRLLEIGVGGYQNPDCGGSSLRMWAEYFPNGKIVGLDINPKKLQLPANVTVVQGRQEDKAFLAQLSEAHGPFDIVIDDGSHIPVHMIASFWALYPLLSPDGIYIIEDTQTCFVEAVGGNELALRTMYPLAYELAMQMHEPEGYIRPRMNADFALLAPITASVSFLRNIICFQRGNNKYPSNTKFSMADPAVADLLRLIEQQMAREPSPRSVLSSVDICCWANAFERAGELALQAMREYPDDLELLQELHFVLHVRSMTEVTNLLAERIAVLKTEKEA